MAQLPRLAASQSSKARFRACAAPAIGRSTCHMRSQWQQTSLREKNVLFDEEWPPWEHFVCLESPSYASAISLKPYNAWTYRWWPPPAAHRSLANSSTGQWCCRSLLGPVRSNPNWPNPSRHLGSMCSCENCPASRLKTPPGVYEHCHGENP